MNAVKLVEGCTITTLEDGRTTVQRGNGPQFLLAKEGSYWQLRDVLTGTWIWSEKTRTKLLANVSGEHARLFGKTLVRVGELFTQEHKHLWDGDKWHVYRTLDRVTKVDAHGISYARVRCLSESGRPPYDWAVDPFKDGSGGGVAAFALEDGHFKLTQPTDEEVRS